jgi:chemotaxis signal transduction protein
MTSQQEILAARAKRLAVPISEATSIEGHSAIVVEIDAQRFAFPLADVRRALVIGPLTELPHVPPIVLGLGTADGDVLAVFDGRVWAGGTRRPSADHTSVLILGSAQAPLALAVDRFAGSFALPPALVSSTGWLQQISEEGILIVRVSALLADPMFSLRAVSEGTVDDHH